MLFSLIYVSSAPHQMSSEELVEILRVSHKNNAPRAITGMLLYKGGNFMQVLEGPEKDVREIFAKIEKDPRHHSIIVLAEEEIEERQFAAWEMAFVNLDDESIRNEPAYSDFLQDEFTAEQYRENPNRATIMLLTFRQNMR
jgi:hypothetical protein